jgi:cyclic pyranopterin phosphate synthase
MPAEGLQLLKHKDILSFEEIADFTKYLVGKGLEKVRITGGEPLVRKGIVELVSMLSKIEGIKDLGMTTNAMILDRFAEDLKKAGLHRINISLDTTDPIKFKEITRGGNLEQVYRGIEAAQKAGLEPVKINCVIKKSSKEEEAQKVKSFCEEHKLEVRYIRTMNLEKGEFSVVDGGSGGDCALCNRLRLTADGILKPCLFSDIGYSIREFGHEKALKLALTNKPKCGTANHQNQFSNIGG